MKQMPVLGRKQFDKKFRNFNSDLSKRSFNHWKLETEGSIFLMHFNAGSIVSPEADRDRQTDRGKPMYVFM